MRKPVFQFYADFSVPLSKAAEAFGILVLVSALR
jgi:hypothetical protein